MSINKTVYKFKQIIGVVKPTPFSPNGFWFISMYILINISKFLDYNAMFNNSPPHKNHAFIVKTHG